MAEFRPKRQFEHPEFDSLRWQSVRLLFVLQNGPSGQSQGLSGRLRFHETPNWRTHQKQQRPDLAERLCLSLDCGGACSFYKTHDLVNDLAGIRERTIEPLL